MKMQISVIFLIIFLVITSCTPSPEKLTTQTAQAWTPTPEATATIIPTPTLDPNADPDGDGYQTSFEEAWGSDPSVYTSFDDLKELDGVISFILHLREPYNLEDMSSTVYQQARFISEEYIEDSGYFDKGPFKTLTVDVVLFPYVTKIIGDYVKTLELSYDIPSKLNEYLNPTITSDSCEELSDVMNPLIENSKTLYQFGSAIKQWNWNNLKENKDLLNTFAIRGLSKITTCEMVKTISIANSCTPRANLAVSEFREAGVPSGVSISLYPTDIDEVSNIRHLETHAYRASDHIQTMVWTPRYGFIVYDPYNRFEGARRSIYAGLFISEIVPDYSDSYKELWFNSDDGPNIPRGHPQPDWLYYSENLQAPHILIKHLLPGDW